MYTASFWGDEKHVASEMINNRVQFLLKSLLTALQSSQQPKYWLLHQKLTKVIVKLPLDIKRGEGKKNTFENRSKSSSMGALMGVKYVEDST